MKNLKTITGRKFRITSNKSQRTFTIRTENAKYRTIKMPKEEFESCLNNTGNDWAQFLTSDDYYVVK